MKKGLVGAAMAAVVFLQGCASAPASFPDRREALVSVTSRPEAIGGSRVIENSYVSLSYLDPDSGKRSMYPYIGGMVGGAIGGALGAIVGSIVHPSRVERFKYESIEPALAVRVDALLAQRLAAAGIPMGITGDRRANVVLLPMADVIATVNGVIVTCRLEVRYSVGGTADAFVHRRYEYLPPTRQLLGTGDGWADNDGAPFKAMVDSAFKGLADAFAADWNGKFAPVGRMRRVRWQRPGMKEPREAALLHETADFAMLAGGTAEAPVTTRVTLVERTALLP